MKLGYTIILCMLLVFVFAGCAAFKATVDGVRTNPEAFKVEAAPISTAARSALPGLPEAAYIGIGYATAFLRRLYRNMKKKETEAKTTA